MGVITLNPLAPGQDIRPDVKPVKVNFAYLKQIRDGGNLIAGQWYRITDYKTTVNPYTNKAARSTEHPFDILVMALDEKTLSEEAFAIQHVGDTYFQNSDLAAWKLRFTLDNVRWSLQKGLYMLSSEDEDYVFVKDGTVVIDGTTYIKWKGDAMFAEDYSDYVVTEDEEVGSTIYVWYGDPDETLEEEFGTISTLTNEQNEGKGTILWMKDEFNNECPYDFKNIQFKRYMATDSVSGRDGLGGKYMVADLNYLAAGLSVDDETDFIWAFTFSSDNSGGEQTDYSLGGQDIHDNVFKPHGESLPNNVMFGYGNYANNIGVDCYNNSWGNGCYGNSWGNGCYGNSWGNQCYNNSWGNSCFNNSWGNNCRSNSWGNQCNGNSWGNSCQNNSWGNECYYNSWGKEVTYTTMFDGVQYTQITTEKVKYAQVLNGVAGTSNNKLTLGFAAQKAYTQVAALTTSGTLEIYVPGDLV